MKTKERPTTNQTRSARRPKSLSIVYSQFSRLTDTSAEKYIF